MKPFKAPSFSFHGQCDLVMLASQSFDHEQGMIYISVPLGLTMVAGATPTYQEQPSGLELTFSSSATMGRFFSMEKRMKAEVLTHLLVIH